MKGNYHEKAITIPNVIKELFSLIITMMLVFNRRI